MRTDEPNDVDEQTAILMQNVRAASATLSDPQILTKYFTDRILPKVTNNQRVGHLILPCGQKL